MDRHLSGKVAWVTGSSRGIGRVVAAHLASLGARVAVNGTAASSGTAFGEGESLAAVAAAIAAESRGETMAVPADLCRPDEVRAAAQAIRARWEQIDILVCVAGGDIGAAGASGPAAGRPSNNDAIHLSLEDMHAVIDRNLMSCIYTCAEVAPEMMARRAGKIVTTGSTSGLVGEAEGAVYAAAKAAVQHYTRCLACQLRPYNVAANCIAPGLIVTRRIVASRQVSESELALAGPDVDTLERPGQPIEIARAVEFLVADTTTYVTGQVLRVDGGSQLWPA